MAVTSESPTISPTNSQVPTTPLTCPELGFSNKNCSELGFTVNIGGKDDSLEICGGSKYSDGTCFPAAATKQEAESACLSIEARLCTKDEIVNWETTGTGCGYDTSLIWTSTECLSDPGKFYTPKGQGGTLGMVCTAPTVNTIAVRCCGDVTLDCQQSNCASLQEVDSPCANGLRTSESS